jgi:diguanylate cyclase (GGDEF)-like protein
MRWLAEAHGALGLWTSVDGDHPPAEPVLDPALLPADAELVAARIDRARTLPGGTVERLERGVLVIERSGEHLGAMLLPTRPGSAGLPGDRLDRVRADLQALLEALSYWDATAQVAPAATHGVESPATVALRLAFDLERELGGEVLVAVVEGGGVRLHGVSSRADKRLLGAALPPEAPLSVVARGEVPSLRTPLDPAGRAVADRRHRDGHAEILPVAFAGRTVAAVAISLPGDAPLVGAPLQAVHQALMAAAPRLEAALETALHRGRATSDPLTGLLNRRGLAEVMNSARASTGALIACDLDRFKKLNDTLGHAAGDAALVHFAAILRELVRDSDTAARVGGEEFQVWAPGAPLARGREIAERIRARLAGSQWSWQGTPWPLTASFGVAAVPETSQSIHNLAVQADAALYVAKEHGRDRVEVAR